MVREIREKSLYQIIKQSAREIGGKTIGAYATAFVLFIAIGVTFFLAQRNQTIFQHASTTGTSPCQFQKADAGAGVAFCDTFDAPAGTGNRSGQLDGNVWGVSRTTGDNNMGPDQSAPWVKATLDGCNGPQAAQPDFSDIIICNGQLREASNDNATGAYEAGTVTSLTMYPKQPFDFAGRTGTIAFDVSDDNGGTHSSWPEIWVTDKPIPAPFVHFGNWNNPQNGFAIRFAGSYQPGDGNGGSCPDDGTHRVFVSSAAIFRNYIADDDDIAPATFNLNVLGCVHASQGPNGALNHVEIRVSQNTIDVWMSDAGSTALKQVAQITNANLTLTRGLVWLEDSHYNADKGPSPSQRNHTYTWDNFGFDGPATYRDRSIDVLDSLTPCHDGTVCLGYRAFGSTQPASVNTLPVDMNDINAATGQRIMFNAYYFDQPKTFSFTINGHAYSMPWPFPYSSSYGTSTFSFDINKADLISGPQAIKIWADQNIVISNINIVLVNVGPVPGGTTEITPPASSPTPILPTVSQASPTPTPKPTSTPIPNNSPTPTTTPLTGDTTSPSVTLNSPAPGSILTNGSIVTISATATDNVKVSRVDYYVGGSTKCSATTTTSQCPWTVPVRAGTKSYNISVRAYDKSGNYAISSITVSAQ